VLWTVLKCSNWIWYWFLSTIWQILHIWSGAPSAAGAEPVIWSAAAAFTAGVWAELRPAAPALAGRAAGTGVLAVTYSVASISSAATQDA